MVLEYLLAESKMHHVYFLYISVVVFVMEPPLIYRTLLEDSQYWQVRAFVQ